MDNSIEILVDISKIDEGQYFSYWYNTDKSPYHATGEHPIWCTNLNLAIRLAQNKCGNAGCAEVNGYVDGKLSLIARINGGIPPLEITKPNV